jgi:hypothetical protein
MKDAGVLPRTVSKNVASVKDIFSVLLASPHLGRASASPDAEDDLQVVQIIIYDTSTFLTAFASYVGKEIQWNSIYKRLRRGFFELESDLGASRVFSAKMTKDQVDFFWGREREPAALPKRLKIEDSSTVLEAVEAVEAMLSGRGVPAAQTHPGHWAGLAPPVPKVVRPHHSGVSEVDVLKPTSFIKFY